MGLNNSPETKLLRQLAQVAGHDLNAYQARRLPDGGVQVAGPQVIAYYPAVAWTSKFVRHLYSGFYGASQATAPKLSDARNAQALSLTSGEVLQRLCA